MNKNYKIVLMTVLGIAFFPVYAGYNATTVALRLINSAKVDSQANEEVSDNLEDTNAIIETVESLSEDNDIDARNADGVTTLMLATEEGSVEKVTALLEAQANPNLQDISGNTALHYAARNGKFRATTVLLSPKAGIIQADPNLQDSTGKTPLMHAAVRGYTPVVELLLEGGADVSIKDNFGYTALYYARKGRNAGIIAILSTKKSVQKENSEGR